MNHAADNIVTVNTGSSSIKLAVFTLHEDILGESPFLTMSMSDIGQPITRLEIRQLAESTHTEEMSGLSHVEASRIIIERLASIITLHSVVAVGHRLVHGGMKYTSPIVVEDMTDADWAFLAQLDPEHTPAAHQLINQFTLSYPGTPEIVCFDTAFFRDMPQVAKIIPIPQKYYAKGVRRYGFHGLSYTSLLKTFREKAGDSAMNGRVILAHLGSGASLAAVCNGKPVDTTMGFTPTSGIVMSTRSGDLDPNIYSFLHRQSNMSIDEFDHMVSTKAGLLGISQLTGDMHALLEAETKNEDAALAVELFVRDVRKSIGALATTLGGVDSVIFSGGIGERSAVLRSRICSSLGYMGIELNEDSNAKNEFLISSERSGVGVHVILANEAQVIAAQAQALIMRGGI